MWENLHRVDWARLTHAYGPARDAPKILLQLVSSDEKTREAGWDEFGGALNHQGDFYDSTVAAIPFLIEAAASCDVPARSEILDALRERWLDAPGYGGDPLLPEPPGGVDELTPMRPENATRASAEELDDETPRNVEEVDSKSHRRMDLCAWQTGRAIQAGKPTYEQLLDDPERDVAAAAAKLLLLWRETRPRAKRKLIQTIDEEPIAIKQGERILEYGVYADENDPPNLERWIAKHQPAEVRAAAALVWAWLVDPAPPPAAVLAALRENSTPDAVVFSSLPWVGVYHLGPWILPANVAGLVLRLAENKNDALRWNAVEGMNIDNESGKRLSDAQVIPVLLRALEDPYDRIRNEASIALTQRGEAVFENNTNSIPAIISALENQGAANSGDTTGGLDKGASECRRLAWLLRLVSRRLSADQRKRALSGIKRRIRAMAGNRIAPIFHGLGVAGDAFLREQYCLIRRPREFRLRELLEPLAFSSIDPPQLPRKECERRLAELFSQDAAGMIAQTVAVLKSWKGRNVALGAARWLMSLGPAAAPALGAIDRLATGRRDSYEKQVVQTAADFIRMSLTIEPDAAPDGTATSGRSRIAFLSRANEPTSDHAAVQAELEHLLDNPDAYVRTGAAELLLKPKFARRSSERVIASLEIMLSEVAEVDVGVSELYQIEGGWRHWRCERRSPRASALRALYALKRIPSGPRCFQAMLAESMHAAVTFADGALPQRFPIGQWRQAIAEAGGIEIAEPQIRAISQSYRERRWRGDRWDSAVESELADVIRRLSRRLV